MEVSHPSIVAFGMLLLSTFVSAASAQLVPDPNPTTEYVYGDSSTKRFYGLKCDVETAAIAAPNLKGFKTVALAEKEGYSRGPTCTQKPIVQMVNVVPAPQADTPPARAETSGPIAQASERRSTPKRPTRVIKVPQLLAITSEPKEHLGKLLSIRATIRISDNFSWSDDHYSFELDDDTATLYVFINKRDGLKLRNHLLNFPYGVRGDFVFFVEPSAFAYLGRTIGELVRFSVTSRLPRSR